MSTALRARCSACRYPAPMHRPLCEARGTAETGVRQALQTLLLAIQELPTPLCQDLAKDVLFLGSYRAAREALK